MNEHQQIETKQISVIIVITMLISMVSGIHRFLISLLTNLVAESSTAGLYAYITTPAPLLLWLGLGFTIAPFGLAKALQIILQEQELKKRKKSC